MADFVVDTFTRADAEIDAAAGETGATWTQVAGGGTDTMQILSGAVHGNGTGEAYYYASGLPASADYDVVINLTFFSNVGNALLGAMGRMSTDGNNWVRVDVNGFNNTLVLSDRVGGSDGALSESVAWTEDDQELKLELRGSAAKVYLDDVEVLSGTTAVSAAGRVGLYKFSGGPDADFYRILDITASDAAGGGATPVRLSRARLMGVGRF